MTPKKYVLTCMVLVVSCLLSIAALTAYADPYWLWRESPVWVDGQNPVLSHKMRFSKGLQVVRRQPEVVFVGSSRVQVGINPADLVGVNAYNLGIESLRAYEMRAYVEHLLNWTDTQHIVIGLDFLAFLDRNPSYMEGFNHDLGNYKFLLSGFGTALFSRSAIEDSVTAWEHSLIPGGEWSRSGYMHIAYRSRQFAENLAAYMRDNTYSAPYSGNAIMYLEDIITLTKQQGVTITLFITPVHDEQFKVMAEAGQLESYDLWYAAVVMLAQEQGVTLWDFTQENFYMNSDITQGSNTYYLDKSHYTHTMGRVMLERMGFPVAPETIVTPMVLGAQVAP
ncbi:MAG: hypothetical protein AAF708_03505 [Deinococcota bacterium]